MALRGDAPALTLEQAKAMSPPQLGDALLAPGHPTIVEARVGIQGAKPPPPPGALFQSPIELVTAATASRETGFCERTVAHLLLAPVVFTEGKAPAARPVQITNELTYSWLVTSGERGGCSAPYKQFFSVEPGAERQAFALVRALANLHDRAKAGLRIDTEVIVEDREAPRRREFARTNTDPRVQPTSEEMTPITDAGVALAAIPIGDIASVVFGRQLRRDWFKGEELVGRIGAKRELATVFAGGEWTIDMVVEGHRIAAIRIIREVPPPF